MLSDDFNFLNVQKIQSTWILSALLHLNIYLLLSVTDLKTHWLIFSLVFNADKTQLFSCINKKLYVFI